MAIEIRPLNPHVGAEIGGVDLARPLDAEAWQAIHRAFLHHGVLLFRGQELSKAQHVAFSRRFGPLELHVVRVNTDPEFPEIFILGNVEEPSGGKPFLSRINETWHSDSNFLAEPSTVSLLYCRVAPREGAETEFASARTGYDSLDPGLKRRIQGRIAHYSYAKLHQRLLAQNMAGVKPMTDEERARYPDVFHPVVRLLPETGARAIYVCENSAEEISGIPKEETEDLVAALCAHVTRPEAVYRHRWRVGDLVMWDNRCTLHRATAFDPARARRLMHRTTVAGGQPLPAPPEAVP